MIISSLDDVETIFDPTSPVDIVVPAPPALVLTAGQDHALRTIVDFLTDDSRLCVLTGYAGTGKTTIIRLIAALARETDRNVYILAPTGKAALRVREATGEDAQTIHRFLYQPRENPETGEVMFEPKGLGDLEEAREALVVIDEASMVGRRIWDHLSMAAAVIDMKILLVGDPFQLEPIQDASEGAFAPLDLPTPHRAHLDEVVRQALDSPVLRAATGVRLAASAMDVSRALTHLTGVGSGSIVDLAVASPEVPILCHRNVTRHQFNRDVRARRGLPPELQVNEPLLVLRNNYPIDRMNGEIVTVSSLGSWAQHAVRDRRTNEAATLRYALGALYDERSPEAAAVALCADEVDGTLRLGEFVAEIGYRAAWRAGDIPRGDHFDERPPFLHANFGYALTAHKAQGSEWDRVMMVLEPSVGAHTVSGRRWIYTAITRAKQEVLWTYL